jgi:hypothetical protein
MNGTDELEQQLRELESMKLEGLRSVWRRHFGAPPRFRSTNLLRRMLAFELQAMTHGGLSAELKQKLRASRRASRKPRLQPGSVITREWRGERHVVLVRDGDFEHHGVSYRSLSHIARAITGAKWSGPRFFGLATDKRAA